MKCTKPADHNFVAGPRAITESKMVPGERVPAICTNCGTRFPCRGACDHVDCRIERGESLPDFIQLVEDNPFGETP